MARFVRSFEIHNEIVDVYKVTFFKITWLGNTETITFYHYKFANVYTFNFKDFYNSFEEMIMNYPNYRYFKYSKCEKVYKEEKNRHFNQIMQLWRFIQE